MTHIRIRKKDKARLRDMLGYLSNDSERIKVMIDTSPIRLESWLRKPIVFKKKKR